MESIKLSNPALKGAKGFLIGAGVFADAVAHKLDKTFAQLISDGDLTNEEVFSLTDKNIPTVIEMKIVVDLESPMSTD